ncbi:MULTISPECIES: DUF397 domain-containing protein [unclassified Streptomyces]|uniref:DUF397 domain-containing protein n=1 Tax=unclassified Streptomyces TaxID=2593676 RepID=UPI00190B0518|nr:MULTISPECIES: DUF397 domain-containing protein [unclassified Streptomyces]MBK3566965.1 DUF397 domain-containing protein [Streptomyces sp. MBT62]MBK6014412.1 DUF397 domain-containing protein [Streptomyces sp. MBT53]
MEKWRKSSYSSDQGGECIEIAETTCSATPATPTTLLIRDSKTPAGPILTLDPAAFTTFVNWTAKTVG